MSAELLAANLTAHWIQAGVLSVVTLCTIHLLRVREPRLRLAVFQLVLVLVVLLPWMQHWKTLQLAPAPSATAQATAIVTVDLSAPLATPAPPLRVQRPVNYPMMALAVIAAGIALRLAWLFLGLIRLRRFARQTRIVAPPEFAEALEAHVGAAPQYLEHPTAGSPSTFGIFKPRVVLPARFATLSASHQQGALCHELIHVKRRDVAAALAEEMLMAMLWFHPWIWIVRGRIRVAREQAVDLRVLALTGDREDYVRCLIEMSGHDLMPHLSQAGAAMVRSNELRARVDVIFQEVRMSRLRLATVSTVLAASVGMAAWAAATQVPLHAMAPQITSTAPATLTIEPVERSRAAVNSVQQTIGRQSQNDTTLYENLAAASEKMRQLVQQVQAAQQAPNPQPPAVPSSAPRKLIKVAYAEYPPEAIDKQISGLVKVNITVNAAGDVTVADVTSGPAELRVSAFKAATGLKYAPGAGTEALSVALEYRLDPFGWGVRVIQGPGFVTVTPQGVRFGTGDPMGVTNTLAQAGTPAAPPNAVRVGGDVAPPKKIKDMAPVYPPVAQQARVQGVVILEAIIGENGNVVNTRVLRSIPLLDQAAIDSVSQWQYTPTLINGAPVPVIMTVTVNFTLRDDLTLNIGLPTGGTTTLRMGIGGGTLVDVPNVGKFLFTGASGSTPTARTIAIYQAGEPGTAPRPLGTFQVEPNGGAVQTPTTPSFSVELVANP